MKLILRPHAATVKGSLKLILRPHAATVKGSHDMIEILNAESNIPWGLVHIDTFWQSDGPDDIYTALYRRGETVTVDVELSP